MPTKRNRAGNQQNYVPKGYGDASGEYGDNASGSNKHIQFANFKKPSRSNEIGNDEYQSMASYIMGRHITSKDEYNGVVDIFRKYSNYFGDLSNFSDDEIKDIIEEIQNLKKSEEPVYIKDGKDWKLTKNVGLLDRLGTKYYTKEEKEAMDRAEGEEIIKKTQTKEDKEIQEKLGKGASVCFGKGYSKDDLEQIKKDTDVYFNDFPELKDTIKNIGDRNNLEKYLNALKKTKELTEDDITKEIAKIKKYSFFSYSDEELRKKAITNLKSPIKITKHNDAYAYWSPSEHSLIYMGKMKKLSDETKDYEYLDNFKSSNKRNATYCHEMGHAVKTSVDEFVDNKIKELNKSITDSADNSNLSDLEKMEIINKNSPRVTKLQNLKNDFNTKLKELRNQNVNNDYASIFQKRYYEKYGTTPDDMNVSYFEKGKRNNAVKEELFNEGIRKYNLSRYGNTNLDEFIAESFSAYYTNMNNPLANKVVELFKNYSKQIKEI